jgi:hypothetical protein
MPYTATLAKQGQLCVRQSQLPAHDCQVPADGCQLTTETRAETSRLSENVTLRKAES